MTQQSTHIEFMSENAFIAEKLGEVADLLDQQAAAPFRARAYREAALYVATLPHPIRTIYEKEGRRGLEKLPTIGVSISGAVATLLESGAFEVLERLRGATDPETLFQTIPMIGPTLARLIHETLNVETLEALEEAAIDGRLASVKGIGKRRVDGIRHALNHMLARRRPEQSRKGARHPDVKDILAVDDEYRSRAATLPAIKPWRFNESGERRIPILHTERGDWAFTALYSNTAAAHEYRRTEDWVVIYYEHEGAPDGLATVITAHGGQFDGKRVVRGLEEACADYYGPEAERKQNAEAAC
ncbi:MAG: helix-hairpin-helix domain-containing protein [Sulfitobacter sp.]